jgi:hypothetical protein
VSRRPPRCVVILPSISDELDEATKNALAARNMCAIEGQCPSCGAVGELRATGTDGVYGYVFSHEPECIVLGVLA